MVVNGSAKNATKAGASQNIGKLSLMRLLELCSISQLYYVHGVFRLVGPSLAAGFQRRR
jgi:hypothetical protein